MLTTLHAGSAEETVARLVLLARYGIDLPSELIEEQVASALDGIVMSERQADGRRFVGSFTGVFRTGEGAVGLDPYVVFDSAARTWELVREPPFVARAVRAGLIDAREVDGWRSRHASALAA